MMSYDVFWAFLIYFSGIVASHCLFIIRDPTRWKKVMRENAGLLLASLGSWILFFLLLIVIFDDMYRN